MARKAQVERKTAETNIAADLGLDGAGRTSISTGIPFLDHMLTAFAAHAGFDLTINAEGDLEVDAHHLVEDVGLVMGQAFREAIGEKQGIMRFGSVLIPMDEALVQVVIDISGRPFLAYRRMPVTGYAGGTQAALFQEFFRAFVNNAAITMHIDLRSGEELHHIFEATYKAVGRSLAQAVAIEENDGQGQSVPSTKGSLE